MGVADQLLVHRHSSPRGTSAESPGSRTSTVPQVDNLLTKHSVLGEQLLPGPEGVGDDALNDLQD